MRTVLIVAESERIGLAGQEGEVQILELLFCQWDFQLHHLTCPGHEVTVRQKLNSGCLCPAAALGLLGQSRRCGNKG